MNNETRLTRALQSWWVRAEQRRWEHGKLGRTNADGTVTIIVAERPGFVYVTMDTGTLTHARNQGRVPLRAGLPVDLKREADGVMTLDRQTPTGLMEDDPYTPDEYAVPPHPLSSHIDVEITNPQDGDVLTYDAASGKWKNVAPTP